MAAEKTVFVIMAGGSGTRFWPASRKEHPKQFLKLWSERSFLQQTYDRILPLAEPRNIFVCAAKNQKALVEKDLPKTELILEPSARNTAPCLMLSVAELLGRGIAPSTPLVMLPADHYMGDPDTFRKSLTRAIEFVRTHKVLVTFGIVPTQPHTGYGYIEAERAGDIVPVKRFVEKPTREKAESFLRAGNFFWNSGIFVWTLETITDAFTRYMPADWHAIRSAETVGELSGVYHRVTPTSIDVGILEKADNVYVMPSNFAWSDVGSWGAVFDLRASSPTSNVVLEGAPHFQESEGCLVKAPPGKQVALVGLKNVVVVDEGDRLLVLNRDKDQAVRNVAEVLDRG